MSHRQTFGMVATAVAAIVVVSVLQAEPERGKTPPPRDVTLTGKIVDLQSFMTGQFKSSDHKRCTQDCIRAGVPAAIQTDDGIVIIGEGTKGPQRTIMPLAFRQAELKGKLYEREGMFYIDITSAKAAKRGLEPDADGEEPWTPETVEPEQEEQLDDGACCLSDGDCYETDPNDCLNQGGKFHRGVACENVECGPEQP